MTPSLILLTVLVQMLIPLSKSAAVDSSTLIKLESKVSSENSRKNNDY